MSTFKKEQAYPGNYVPVTMDELMNRFVLNLKRDELNQNFTNSKKILDKKFIGEENGFEVEKSV